MKSMTITGNGQTSYLSLYQRSKVVVYYVGAAAGTLTPYASNREGELIGIDLPNGNTTITASYGFILEGEGLLSFNGSGVSGTIKVDIDRA